MTDETFDFARIQERWLPVWDELKPFSTDDADRQAAAQVRARHVPVPLGRPAHGSRGGVRARRRASRATGASRASTCCTRSAGTPSACPPRTPRSSAASTRAEWTYGEHRAAASASMRRYATAFDWDRVLHTSDPEYYKWNQWLFLKLLQEGPRLPQGQSGQLVPRRPDGARRTSRSSTAAASAAATSVVKKKLTQWYFKITDYADRLLDDLNQLEGTVARQGHRDAAQLDRPLDRRGGRVRDRGPRRAGHRLHDAPRHALRRDLHGRRPRLRPGGRARRRVDPRGAEAFRSTSSRCGG